MLSTYIQDGKSSVDMYNLAKNKLRAKEVTSLLNAGEDAKAYSLFKMTISANDLVNGFKNQTKSTNNG